MRRRRWGGGLTAVKAVWTALPWLPAITLARAFSHQGNVEALPESIHRNVTMGYGSRWRCHLWFKVCFALCV